VIRASECWSNDFSSQRISQCGTRDRDSTADGQDEMPRTVQSRRTAWQGRVNETREIQPRARSRDRCRDQRTISAETGPQTCGIGSKTVGSDADSARADSINPPEGKCLVSRWGRREREKSFGDRERDSRPAARGPLSRILRPATRLAASVSSPITGELVLPYRLSIWVVWCQFLFEIKKTVF